MKSIFNRRDLLRAAGLTATSQILPTMSFAAGTRAKRPNILIIHVDEHRIECLGAYGNADIKTPNIDLLAADGVRYDNSFCPFPVCTPSRYSLLCGRYVHEHSGWTNRDTLAPGIATYPKILKAAGYRTNAVGKMHFTPTYLDVGFDEMVLAEQDGPGRWDDDYRRYLMRRGLDAGVSKVRPEEVLGHVRRPCFESTGRAPFHDLGSGGGHENASNVGW